MTVCCVVLILLCILLLVSLVPVGGWVEYSERGLLIRLKIGVISVQVFPSKSKEKKAKQSKTSGEKEPVPAENPKKGGTFELVKEFLPLVAEAAGELKRKISIDEFRMDLLWGVPDPAACAMGFGAANAAVGMIWPLIEQNFHVRNRCIRTAVDFERGRPTIYLCTQITMRLGQLVSFDLRLGTRALKIYQSVKKQQDTKEFI